MRTLILLILILAGTTYGQSLTSKKIQIEFNHNVEFGGFVFFLGSMGAQYEDSDELTARGIKKKDWYAYNLSLYKKYKSFKKDKDLATAVQYLERLEGSPLIRLLISVAGFPKAKLLDEIDDHDLLAFSMNTFGKVKNFMNKPTRKSRTGCLRMNLFRRWKNSTVKNLKAIPFCPA